MEKEEFIERVKLGLYEEYELVNFITKYLLHPSQTQWLTEQDLRVEDILNGRFNGEQEPTVEAFLLDWNLNLGVRMFSLGGEKLWEAVKKS
jgi:hypothetical protein